MNKPKRIVCEKTLASYRGVVCMACGKLNSSDPAHIKTVKSGGHDSHDNLVALCRVDHTMQHKVGWVKFLTKYPNMIETLYKKGWEVKDVFGVRKLVRIDHGL